MLAITDLKKERARNLLPAYVGVYGIIIFLINTIMINLAHGPAMVIHLGVNVSAALLVSLQEMDSNERALMVAVSTDFYLCLYSPALVLYACPVVRRNFRAFR